MTSHVNRGSEVCRMQTRVRVSDAKTTPRMGLWGASLQRQALVRRHYDSSDDHTPGPRSTAPRTNTPPASEPSPRSGMWRVAWGTDQEAKR